MHDSVAVSVVIPAHNAGELLAVQLSALAHQDYDGRLEIVVVDNNSTDGSVDHLEISDSGQAVRIVRAHDGVGPAYARNRGADAAHGELLLFCDADDRVHPDWVRKMVDFLHDGRYDIVTSAVEGRTLNPAGHRKIAEIASPENFQSSKFFAPIVVGCSFGCTAAAYRDLGGIDETYRANEEVEFGWRAVRSGYRVGYLPEALVAYRYRVGFRAGFHQGMSRGTSFARLADAFPGSGLPAQSATRLCRELLGLAVARATPEERGLLTGIALGRLRGAITHRTLRL
ncbi:MULTISPECIES: glycosyltransferase family 2 protein [unclassified Rhodococcus (in: high G+C Gram-positive bacteria)]|uniref:glycosyltransferase n=1 Tax=unclassified Rhodococcus (in: high G+C Gram-positive bacteria) TaxID=192944 RepID=UPI0015C652D0|nr:MULTISPECIES: glycosyltransferase family 2 protein [unclassified Rhodococcus (in: high G+C Gram-positive bacteria)]